MNQHPNIDLVALSSAGEIQGFVSGSWRTIGGPDTLLHQVELDSSRLWALDTNGQVYFRGRQRLDVSWQLPKSLPRVRRLIRHRNGIVLAFCENGEIRTLQGVESNSAAQYPAAPHCLKSPFEDSEPALKPFRSRWRLPKPGLKHLLALGLLVAIIMGPVASYRQAKKRDRACAALVAGGGKFVYEHEIDAQGNPVANPQEPGPKFLRKWLPQHWFVKPVKFSGSWNQNLSELTALDSIEEVGIYGSWSYAKEIKSLENLDSLRSLEIKGRIPTDDVPPLPQVCSLKLDCFSQSYERGRDNRAKVDPEFLVGWTGLTELKAPFDFEVFDFRRHCPQLKSLHVDRFESDRSISQLKDLEELSIKSDMSFSLIADLPRLKHLRFDAFGELLRHPDQLKKLVNLEYLALNNVPVSDLAWLRHFPNLKYLELNETKSIVDVSPLANLPKLKTLKFKTIHDHCWKQLEAIGIEEVHIWDQNDWLEVVVSSQPLEPEEIALKDFFLHCINKETIRVPSHRPNGEVVKDCSPLTKPVFSQLHQLRLPPTIEDFSPIADLAELTYFSTSSPMFSDVGVLSNMKQLKNVYLDHTSISSIDGFTERQINQLHGLYLSNTNVLSIQQLRSAKRLEFLSLNNTPLKELPPLPPSLCSLSAAKTEIVDFSVVSGQTLRHLEINGSLAEKLPENLVSLKNLEINATRISSLEALQDNFQLNDLLAEQTPIEDASLLSGFRKLRKIKLSGSRVRILPNNLPKLRILELAATPVEDLSQLKQLPSLYTLDLSASKVIDITPLAELTRLKDLKLADTGVTDISVLADLPRLESLDLSGTTIKDFSPLKQCQKIATLNLSRTNIESLKSVPLNKGLNLNLSRTELSDISSLPSEAKLTTLDLSRTQIKDLTMLARHVELSDLNVSHTAIRDLTPLSELPMLSNLNISHSRADLSTLKSIYCHQPLALNVRGCETTSLSDLMHFGMLRGLAIDCENIEDLSPLAKLTRLSWLELGGLRGDHDLSWVRDLPCLKKLHIEGNPIDASILYGMKSLKKVRLPKGSTFDNKTLLWLEKLRTYRDPLVMIGDEEFSFIELLKGNLSKTDQSSR